MSYGWYGGQSAMIGGGMTRMVKNLILVNVGVFILQMASGGRLDVYLGLNSVLVFRHLFLWQFLTYMFLHSVHNLFHILINMYILWMFGRELESIWGEKAFLRFYLTCGIGAGIISSFFTMGSPAITIGASGAIFGILVAYAVVYPERLITVFILIFPLPPMKAKHVVMIFAGMELLFGVSGTAPGIAHFAHLGGGVIGFIYLRAWKRRSLYGVDYRESFLSRLSAHFRRWQESQKENQADVFDKEVDRILDKISNGGIKSLSRREKSILRKKSTKQ